MTATAIAAETAICSCGCVEAHVVARRRTFDGKTVCLWSDGDITLPLGFCLKGLGRGQSAFAERCNARAARIVFADAGLLTVAELTRDVRVARKLTREGGWPNDAAILRRVRQLAPA